MAVSHDKGNYSVCGFSLGIVPMSSLLTKEVAGKDVIAKVTLMIEYFQTHRRKESRKTARRSCSEPSSWCQWEQFALNT
jgi:hypothetical protein